MIDSVFAERLAEYAPANALEQEHALQEIMQHYVLASLSMAGLFTQALFHGGTCLRIVHRTQRYSEGLDFLLKAPDPSFRWEPYLDQVRRDEPALEVRQETPDMVDLPLDPRGGEEFAGFVQQVLGSMLLPAGLQGAGYGTDASSLGPARIPAVVLGPGSIAQGHTADEWIDLEELDRGVEVYLALMSTALQAGG